MIAFASSIGRFYHDSLNDCEGGLTFSVSIVDFRVFFLEIERSVIVYDV
jgi:hypothetical protein